MTIYPHHHLLQRQRCKELLLGQRGITLWFTGLSGSGKSAIADALERILTQRGHLAAIVDGDNLRVGLCSDLGFTSADRTENIRRAAEVCRLLNNNAVIALATLVSPTNAMRTIAEQIVGSEHFITIHISTPLAECERRDPKGLYARARRGDIDNFTGISAPFEAPERADIEIDTTARTNTECAERIFETIKSRVIYEL